MAAPGDFYSHRVTESDFSENLIGVINDSSNFLKLSKVKSVTDYQGELSIEDSMLNPAVIKFDSSEGSNLRVDLPNTRQIVSRISVTSDPAEQPEFTKITASSPANNHQVNFNVNGASLSVENVILDQQTAVKRGGKHHRIVSAT